MPFVKDDPNINKLDTLPEKFTKEFVDYVKYQLAGKQLDSSTPITEVHTERKERSVASSIEQTPFKTDKLHNPVNLSDLPLNYMNDMHTEIEREIDIEALNKMKPKDRVDFFVKQIDLQKITNESNIKGESYTGVLTTVAALGLAQASGFGIFLASTTALGFLTHAVGITLPFAVYSGLGSTIAFVIGPAGWLAAGAFFSWKLTKAEWKKIIPALIYIISVNSRKCT